MGDKPTAPIVSNSRTIHPLESRKSNVRTTIQSIQESADRNLKAKTQLIEDLIAEGDNKEAERLQQELDKEEEQYRLRLNQARIANSEVVIRTRQANNARRVNEARKAKNERIAMGLPLEEPEQTFVRLPDRPSIRIDGGKRKITRKQKRKQSRRRR